MFDKIVWWLKGYVLIRITGGQTERFLNVCCYNDIFFREVRCNDECLIVRCRLTDLKKIKKHLRKSGVKLRIIKKTGLPFKLAWLSKQKPLIISVIIFITIVFVMSMRIWHIEVNGSFVHTPEQIISYLEKINVKYGMETADVDCGYIEASIRKKYTDISWVSCEQKGTNLIINIKEAADYNRTSDADTEIPETGHIIAKNDGIITEIITRKGTPLVKVGDIVKKGDVLVSGIVEVIADNTLLVNAYPVLADSDIRYKTLLKYEDRIPLNYSLKEYTGNKKTGFDINIFGIKIFAYYHRKLYNKYDIIKDTVSWKVLDEFYLPIEHNVYDIYEYIPHDLVYSADEVRCEAEKRLLFNLEKLSETGTMVLNYELQGRIISNTYIYSGYVTVIEDAGMYREVTEEELSSVLNRIPDDAGLHQ